MISRRAWFACLPAVAWAQGPQPSRRPEPKPTEIMPLHEYEPRSTLVVPQNPRTRAKFPFIDVHNHQPRDADVERLVKDMDALNLQVMVNLSGSYGDWLKQAVENFKGKYKNRFVVFANLDFRDIDAPDYPQRVAKQLETDIHNGAQGLKIFKNFGMDLKDSKGNRIKVDDPRFDWAFQVLAKYNLPCLIHTAEPKSFF